MGLVDWSRLGQLVAGIYAAPVGRPSYPHLLMVKVLLLQQWYNLSDPQLEAALGDRLSFHRFVGLGLQDATPDHSTSSRFRTALGEAWSAQRCTRTGRMSPSGAATGCRRRGSKTGPCTGPTSTNGRYPTGSNGAMR